MLQSFRKILNCTYGVCVYLAIFTSVYGYTNNELIVSYVTAHLNFLPNAVQGVLVTPSGQVFKTGALGPFSNQKIVISDPEDGSYQAYYQALIDIKPKYCYIVGGVDANLCNHPFALIPFTPFESHIQGFTQSEMIRVGAKTLPIATFSLPVD